MAPRNTASDIRNEILDATVALIDESGIHAATMRRIAQRAGCTTGKLTHYYANKEEIIVAALTQLRSRAAQSLARAATQGRGVERIRNFVLATLPDEGRTGSVASWRVWINLWNEALIESYASAEWDRRAEGYELMLRQVVEAARADGDLDPHISTDSIVQLLAMIVYGAGSNAILRPPADSSRSEEALIELALRSIVATTHTDNGITPVKK